MDCRVDMAILFMAAVAIFVLKSREADQQFSMVFRKYLLFNTDERLFVEIVPLINNSFLSAEPFCTFFVTSSSCGQKLDKYGEQMSNFSELF